MPLTFPNVALLGLTQDSRFFNAGFQYAANRRLSIQGNLIDLANGFGITGIWDGPEGLIATVRNQNDYQDLYLNGVSFGSGKIQNISFDPGNDVRTKTYRANIEVQDSGNLFNLTGFFYSGIDISRFQYLNAFNETYAFDRKQNGGYSYTHGATIQFSSGVGNLNAIGAAQSLARTLFTGSNLGLAFYSGYTNKQGKRFVNESYNLVDNSCAFQETFDFDSDMGAYSAQRTNVFEMGEDGIINVSENGTLRGIENPNYQRALSAVAIETTGSYLRCSGVQAFYYPSGVALSTYPIINGRTLDIFGNVVTYTLTYTNNPSNSGTYLWDYTQQITRQDNVSVVEEQGTVVGRGADRPSAFVSAQAGFVIVKAGIPGRTTNLYTSAIGSATNYLESKSESHSPFQGQIGYGYQFSNDPSLVSSVGVRRIDVTEETNSPVYSYNRLNIFNYKEIAQNDYQSTPGQNTLRLSMQGDKSVGLSTFLASGLAEANARQPGGLNQYLGEASYTYAPNENTVELNVTWLFNALAVRTIQP